MKKECFAIAIVKDKPNICLSPNDYFVVRMWNVKPHFDSDIILVAKLKHKK